MIAKKNWFIVNSSHNWLFKPHQSADFEGAFPPKSKLQVDYYFTEERECLIAILVLNHIIIHPEIWNCCDAKKKTAVLSPSFHYTSCCAISSFGDRTQRRL